jgi:acetylornithine deacetylase/succinyl-diaminopimelate desuccinylase-like protein
LLQELIRFDTTNPPGDEAECIRYIHNLLSAAGLQATILEKIPQRSNLVARLKGEGRSAPLLLYGHVDVVTTESQSWQRPPFSGELADGYIWGRGALDMKSGVAMFLAAILKANKEGLSLPGDVILCVVADEENGGDFGARYLVEEHAGLFQDVRYALGEFGGFNMRLVGKRLYPIMVAEKQICAMKMTFRGQGGHGSMPVQGGAMAKAARALSILDRRRLPYHLTPAAQMMIAAIAAAMGGAAGVVLRQAANPLLANRVIQLLGESGETLIPLLHNTVSPTILQASSKVNVIPAEVSIGLDGRLLPGFTPDTMVQELRALLGNDFELEIVAHDPGPAAPDMGLFDLLAGTLKSLDTLGHPVPLLLSGVTDARFFSRLGIQTYGFTPLKLPDDFNFIRTIHAADERLPVEALDFGLEAVYRAIQMNRPG